MPAGQIEQEVAPKSFASEPAWHREQEEAEGPAKKPGGQRLLAMPPAGHCQPGRHSSFVLFEPTGHHRPAEQARHVAALTAPTVLEKVPDGHCAVRRSVSELAQYQPTGHGTVFTVEPGAQKMPGGQKSHVDELVAVLKVPSGHSEHVALLAPEKEPAGHAAQPAALAVPGFVTTPAKPGAHVEHAERVVCPAAEAVVKMPAGHLVQLDSPELE